MPAIYRTTCVECGAPRDPNAKTGRCAKHQREHDANLRRAHRFRHPGYDAERSRLIAYSEEAVRQGAEGIEVTWLALACDLEHEKKNGKRPKGWFVRFVSQELAWLRARKILEER